jgi:hypothetical protein
MVKEKSSVPKMPYSVGDRGAFIRKAAVALELVNVPTVRVVTYNIPRNCVEVIEIPVSRLSTDANTKDQYYIDGGHISGGFPAMAKIHLSWLRHNALISGATPDAIRLLSKATGAFTKKEEKEMAEKLKSKSAAKADKEGLKAGAKAAPVSKKASTKRGNPEALAKARAAKGPPPNRKYKGLVKAKDLTLRGWTRRMAEIALGNTTTDAANAELKKDKEYSDKRIDYSWLASKGIISKPA